jgi:hypothetical protein
MTKQTKRLSVAEPRFATPRTDRPTAGGECARIAEILRVPLMPWQQQVLDVAMEYEPDSDYPMGRRYVYREIDYSTPRQSGKTIITLAKLLHRTTMCGPAQQVLYSMQSGNDAVRKMMTDWVPIIQESPFSPAVSKIRTAMGSEKIVFRNGSLVEPLRSGKSSGHGRTIDEGIIDEAMHDLDDRREQAMVPAMLTKPAAQLVVTSTAGTDESLYWRRKIDMGRDLALAGSTEDVCFFEWSAPDDVDPYDEEVWWATMPALGRTQPLAAVRQAAKTMREEEFRRAMLNQWTRRMDQLIDWMAWTECRSTDGSVGVGVCLAVDVSADRDSASIAAASRGSDGVIDLELIEQRSGIAWIVERTIELVNRHFPMKVLVDGAGPVGALIPELERAGVVLSVVGQSEMPKAAGSFMDHVRGRRYRVRPNERLDAAVAGAAVRVRGEAFTWMRVASGADISPLTAATLAAWGVAGDPVGDATWIY